MNPSLLRQSLVLLLTLTVAAVSYADSSAYAQIVKERDQVLSQILASREERHRIGGAPDLDGVFHAKIALLRFRRDTASATIEKIKQQELIAAECQRQFEIVKHRIVSVEEIWLAQDQTLEAKQLLEQLRAQK